MKRFSSLFLVSLLSGAVTLGSYKLLFDDNGYFSKKSIVTQAPNSYGRTVGLSAEAVDFTEAADKTIHTVVHVKNVSRKSVSNPILEYFYGYRGDQLQEQVGTGSGVIISEDGYIVTNNHVIGDADEITVIFNDGKKLKAEIPMWGTMLPTLPRKIDAFLKQDQHQLVTMQLEIERLKLAHAKQKRLSNALIIIVTAISVVAIWQLLP